MRRKEKEKLVLDALGLKVGDIVSINYIDNLYTEYRVEEEKYSYSLSNKVYKDCKINISVLLVNDYKVVTQKKTKGELICESVRCVWCPLYSLNCDTDTVKNTLYTQLECLKEDMPCKAYEEYKKVLDEEIE